MAEGVDGQLLNTLKDQTMKTCRIYQVDAFTLNDADSGILSHGRMFAPAIGIPEDPFTGNANGPLGAYLVHNHIFLDILLKILHCGPALHAGNSVYHMIGLFTFLTLKRSI